MSKAILQRIRLPRFSGPGKSTLRSALVCGISILNSLVLFPQELSHKATVINIEIPVRVYRGTTFGSNLTLKDFEVLDNKEIQDIEAVYLIKGTSIQREEGKRSVRPQVARQFVLLFEMMDWQPELDKALDLFFDDVIQPGDALIVITPMKRYRMLPEALVRQPTRSIKEQIRGKIRRDIVMGASEYRTIIDEMYRYLSKPPEGERELPLDERMHYYTTSLNRLETLRNVDEKGLLEFAGFLKNLPGQKFVYFFYQKELIPQFSPNVDVRTMLDKTDDLALTFKLLEQFQLFRRESRFNVEAVKKAYADSSISVHFLFLTKTPSTKNPIEVYQRADAPSEIIMVDRSEDIYGAFGEVAKATGGISDSSANAAASFVRAVNASENYYLVYYKPKKYVPDGSFHELEVRVKSGSYQVAHRAGYMANRVVLFPPGQLFLEQVEIIPLGRGDEAQLAIGPPNLDGVVLDHGAAALTVEGQIYFFSGRQELNLDPRIRRDDRRAEGEGMRADRRQEDAGNIRLDNWPSRGKRIGRGPRRCGHDQAISLEGLDLAVVDPNSDVDHPGQGALVNDDVIESQAGAVFEL